MHIQTAREYKFADEKQKDKKPVSNYIWRGQDLGSASIQPALSLSYKGISFSAWGSAGLNWSDTREVDLTLGYSIAGFSVSVTDYWFVSTI